MRARRKSDKGIRSLETRIRISQSLTGRPCLESTRQVLQGNKYALGNRHSEETKRKISESLKGRIPWNKGIKGDAIWNNGKEWPDYVKENISRGMIVYWIRRKQEQNKEQSTNIFSVLKKCLMILNPRLLTQIMSGLIGLKKLL